MSTLRPILASLQLEGRLLEFQAENTLLGRLLTEAQARPAQRGWYAAQFYNRRIGSGLCQRLTLVHLTLVYWLTISTEFAGLRCPVAPSHLSLRRQSAGSCAHVNHTVPLVASAGFGNSPAPCTVPERPCVKFAGNRWPTWHGMTAPQPPAHTPRSTASGTSPGAWSWRTHATSCEPSWRMLQGRRLTCGRSCRRVPHAWSNAISC
jgi:hypothetical protein